MLGNDNLMIANLSITSEEIQKLKVDVVCNSAARNLKGGGGVDGAIHKAAGPRLLKSCDEIGFCDYGEAKITQGYKLPSKFIVHTVVPRWSGGNQNEENLLRKSYENSLKLADYFGVESIAFSALGCGVRGYPAETAINIAVDTVRSALQECRYIRQVIFSCPDIRIYELVQSVIKIYGCDVETSEYWCDLWEEMDCNNYEYWFNIVEMLNVHWAVINKIKNSYQILFFNNHGSVFDEISIGTKKEAIQFLKNHQFIRWGVGFPDTFEIPLPDSRLHFGEIMPLYSDRTIK